MATIKNLRVYNFTVTLMDHFKKQLFQQFSVCSITGAVHSLAF
jgi:hypothetical protein